MIKKTLILINIFLLSFILSSCDNEIKFTEEAVIIQTNNYQMTGMLTLPNGIKENLPAVVLIGGSGPTDMNSSVGELEPFKDIAHGLAKKGIASIRFNKRTLQYQSELVTDYNFTPQDEYIDDALSAINLLWDDERIDNENIFLIGHSQGGQFAPVIANQTDKLKGIVVMAGTTSHILDLLMEQILTNYGQTQYNEYLPYYEAVIDIQAPDTSKYNYAYFGAYYNYWLEYNKIDFEAELLECAQNHSILVMQGGKDIQVYPKYYERYQELLPYSTEYLVSHVLYPKLNHMFVDGGNETIYTAYSKKANVDQNVIDTLADSIFGIWPD
ncbi:MAG: alpha/beta fold hydrolase [Candidatus Caldatribacteriota bacterium]